MSMKIFIFKPSDYWGFCGGGYVVSAKNFEEARKLFEDEHHKLFIEDPKNEDEYQYKWFLVSEFEVPSITEAKVILDDYNWG